MIKFITQITSSVYELFNIQSWVSPLQWTVLGELVFVTYMKYDLEDTNCFPLSGLRQWILLPYNL